MPLTSDQEFAVVQIVRSMLASFLSQTRVLRVDESTTCADTVMLDPADNSGQPFSRLEQWGDIVVPPNDTDAVLLHQGFQGVQMPLSMPRWRPGGESSKAGNRGLYSDGENRVVLHGLGSSTPGQVEVVTKSGATVTIDKDGQVSIAAAAGKQVKIDAGAGANIVLNGGTADVARKGDACVIANPMAQWMTQVETGILGAGGVPPAPLSATFVAAPGVSVNAGNPRVKG